MVAFPAVTSNVALNFRRNKLIVPKGAGPFASCGRLAEHGFPEGPIERRIMLYGTYPDSRGGLSFRNYGITLGPETLKSSPKELI